jgi:hypothetical protein
MKKIIVVMSFMCVTYVHAMELIPLFEQQQQQKEELKRYFSELPEASWAKVNENYGRLSPHNQRTVLCHTFNTEDVVHRIELWLPLGVQKKILLCMCDCKVNIFPCYENILVLEDREKAKQEIEKEVALAEALYQMPFMQMLQENKEMQRLAGKNKSLLLLYKMELEKRKEVLEILEKLQPSYGGLSPAVLSWQEQSKLRDFDEEVKHYTKGMKIVDKNQWDEMCRLVRAPVIGMGVLAVGNIIFMVNDLSWWTYLVLNGIGCPFFGSISFVIYKLKHEEVTL